MSFTSKEILAKNLQKSHSSSSLLLSSANLSWTPSSGCAVLVTPQPPVERAVSPSSSESSKVMTNEELIENLRKEDSKANSNQSIDVLDGFQTICLTDNKADDNNANNDNKTVESFVSNTESSVADKKLSLLDQLFSSVRVGGSSQSVSTVPMGTSAINPPQTTTPELSHMSGSYSVPNFGFFSKSLSSSTQSIITPSAPVPEDTQLATQPPIQLPSPVPLQPPRPTEPPKGFVAQNFKIKGPLRLYDPNHGFSGSPVSDKPFTAPEMLGIVEPLTTHPIEGLYNPNNYLNDSSNETQISSNDMTSQTYDRTGQQFSTTMSSCYNELVNSGYNSDEFSFLSETPNQEFNNFNSNQTDWTSSQQPSNQLYYQSMVNQYQPVVHHWFYQKIIENKEVWIPFSMYDSYNLEQAVLSCPNNGYGVVIPTDGGRFDVSVYERIRRPVFWSEVDTIVRRCAWFHKKEGHNRWAPYPEDLAIKLEDSYKDAVLTNRWNQKIELDSGSELVVIHSQQSIYHYQTDHQMPDGWGQALENPVRPQLVNRGALDIFDDIDEGEPEQIDHLVFLIHGIGEICDFSFRSIVEVVDDFRAISLSQMRTNFKPYLESGQLGRIEILPISWHSALHGEETGIDDRLKQITLESIPKLRHFTNDTILDALFYTSPVYCQTIVDNVGQELNRLFALFCQRNANFCGTVALGGHSLGSLIVFDILAHQFDDLNKAEEAAGAVGKVETVVSESDSELKIYEYFCQPNNQSIELLLTSLGFPQYSDYFYGKQILDFNSLVMLTEDYINQEFNELPVDFVAKLTDFIKKFNDFRQKQENIETKVSQTSDRFQRSSNSPINYPFESLGLGFPAIKYPMLSFKPSAFFAMGSPIPMFLTVRGVEYLSPDYRLPTCPAVYNIFHPYDPIAYRLEPMIYKNFKDIKPVLIPHHKGRKRMHLELKESIARMGSDLKSKIYDSLKYTWNSINEFARAHKPSSNSTNTGQIDQNYSQSSDSNEFVNSNSDCNQIYINNFGINNEIEESYAQNLSAGALNSGRRIDYVLQESPVEAFNEYLFAIRAHACYWSSEDTALLILRELYGQLGYFTTPGASQTQPNEQISSSASNHSLDISSSFDLNAQQMSQ